MNRKLIILLVVLVVGIIGGGVYFTTIAKDDGNNGNQSNTESNTNTNTDEESNSSQNSSTQTKGSLATLRTGGKAQECTFSYSNDQGRGSGKMYTDGIGNGLLTMELVSSKGKSGSSNILVTKDKVYSWTRTANGTFGLMFDTDTLNDSPQELSDQSGTSGAQNANQEFDLSCKSWTVDNSKFKVPTDVTFSKLPSVQ